VVEEFQEVGLQIPHASVGAVFGVFELGHHEQVVREVAHLALRVVHHHLGFGRGREGGERKRCIGVIWLFSSRKRKGKRGDKRENEKGEGEKERKERKSSE